MRTLRLPPHSVHLSFLEHNGDLWESFWGTAKLNMIDGWLYQVCAVSAGIVQPSTNQDSSCATE
jgi:hypothetical protein